MTQMTVQDAAKKFSQPPQKLLDELRRKFPEMEWSLTSPLPEDFSEQVDRHAKEYLGDALPKGEITTTQEALLDNREILEALEYGILESLANLKHQDVIQLAQVSAIEDIQAYESAYTDVWQSYYSQKVRGGSSGVLAAEERLKQMMLTRNTKLTSLQASMLGLHQDCTAAQNTQQEDINTLVGDLPRYVQNGTRCKVMLRKLLQTQFLRLFTAIYASTKFPISSKALGTFSISIK